MIHTHGSGALGKEGWKLVFLKKRNVEDLGTQERTWEAKGNLKEPKVQAGTVV